MRTELGVPLLTPKQKESVGERFAEILKKRRQDTAETEQKSKTGGEVLRSAIVNKHKEVVPLIRQINISSGDDLKCIQACLLAACSTPIDLPYDCKWQTSGDRLIGYIHYVDHVVKYLFSRTDDRYSGIVVLLDGDEILSIALN